MQNGFKNYYPIGGLVYQQQQKIYENFVPICALKFRKVFSHAKYVYEQKVCPSFWMRNILKLLKTYIHRRFNLGNSLVIAGKLINLNVILLQRLHDILLEFSQLVFRYRIGFGNDWYDINALL